MADSFEIAAGSRAGAAPKGDGPLPEWHVDFVLSGVGFGVSPPPSLSHTLGSSAEAGEDVEFDSETGLPVSGFLHLGEENLAWDDWRHVPATPMSGQLRLLEPRPFALAETRFRVLDPGGSALIAVLPGVAPHLVDARFQLLPGLDVFVAQGRYGGWMLTNPIQQLRLDGADLPIRVGDGPVQSDGSEAAWLARLFTLVDESGLRRLRSAEPQLTEALETLGEQVDDAATTIAGLVILARIENDLREAITSERRAARNLAVARDRVTGKMYTAKDRGAMARRVEGVHPVVAERVRIERKLVELHRDLRRPGPPDSWNNATTDSIAALIQQSAPLLHDLFQRYGVPASACGISTWDQFARLNLELGALERSQRRAHGAPRLRQWLGFQDAIGNHAEALAVNEALLALEKPRAPRRLGDLLQRLELHVERLGGESDADVPPQVSPRCVHCSFITHGVLPSEEVLEKERAAAFSPGLS